MVREEEQVDSAFSQAMSQLKRGAARIIQPYKNLGAGVGAVVSELSYSPETLPKDWKYRFKTLSDKYQRFAPNLIQIPPQDIHNDPEELKYQSSTPKQRVGLEAMWRMEDAPVNAASADYNRYNFQAPSETPQGGLLKQQILQDPAFLPGARSYLKTIPFVEAPGGYEEGFAGQFNFGTQGEEFIQYDPRNKGGFAKKVGAHELLHASRHALGNQQLPNFLTDLKQAYQKNPKVFKPIFDWMQFYKDSRKETGYFEDPAQEVEELFSEIGAMLGPSILKDPHLGKYYASVFNQKTKPTHTAKIAQKAKKVKIK